MQALQLRLKYTNDPHIQLDSSTEDKIDSTRFFDESAGKVKGGLVFEKGVYNVVNGDVDSVIRHFSLDEFYDDMDDLFLIRQSGPVMSFAYQRLQLLLTKQELYSMLYSEQERKELSDFSHRDFYNVRKVDTHIHHSASMNAKYLFRFIKNKLENHGHDVVHFDAKLQKSITLSEAFNSLGVDVYDISLDKLNVLADKTTLHRFDRFNAKYSPFGEPLLRTIFLKTDNSMGGRYLGEITRSLLNDLEESKFQHTEWRLSIYGRSRSEWDKLAKWVLAHNLLSPNNKWMIQIPRLYSEYRKKGEVKSFAELLANIFEPVIECLMDPSSHPELHVFLKHVSAFDTVDDESKSPLPNDRLFSSRSLTPDRWELVDNPSYKYYCFYIYSNLRLVNAVKSLREGLNSEPFRFRPHSGEAGEIHHLDTTFLLADSINHGINLRRSPVLEYLFYLSQIGIAVSPASNNQLFLPYNKNPFGEFFQRGLNVSLSTDDPLMFHQTKEPLIEEYSIAKQVWRLSSADLCEIARNSVLQSGFPRVDKAHWLGSTDRWTNVIERTNVPNCRVRFRRKTFLEEWHIIKGESQLDSLELFTTERMLMSPRSKGTPMTSPKFGAHPAVDESITGGHKLTDIAPRLKRMKSGLPVDSPVVGNPSSPNGFFSNFGPVKPDATGPQTRGDAVVVGSTRTTVLSVAMALVGFLVGLLLSRKL
jgi:AMP deaminase